MLQKYELLCTARSDFKTYNNYADLAREFEQIS